MIADACITLDTIACRYRELLVLSLARLRSIDNEHSRCRLNTIPGPLRCATTSRASVYKSITPGHHCILLLVLSLSIVERNNCV